MSLDVEEVLVRLRRLEEMHAIYGSINRWLDSTPANQMLKTSSGGTISEEEIQHVISDFDEKMRAISNTKRLLLKSHVSIRKVDDGNMG